MQSLRDGYEAFCLVLGVTPVRNHVQSSKLSSTRRLYIVHPRFEECYAIAYVFALLSKSSAPPSVLIRVLEAYVRASPPSSATLALTAALESHRVEDTLDELRHSHAADIQCDSYHSWIFSSKSLTSASASLLCAAAILLGNGELILRISESHYVHDIELSKYFDIIEEARLSRGDRPFGLKGLILDACPIRRLPTSSCRAFRELRCLSLRATRITNLWAVASMLKELPSLRGLLVKGETCDMDALARMIDVSNSGARTESVLSLSDEPVLPEPKQPLFPCSPSNRLKIGNSPIDNPLAKMQQTSGQKINQRSGEPSGTRTREQLSEDLADAEKYFLRYADQFIEKCNNQTLLEMARQLYPINPRGQQSLCPLRPRRHTEETPIARVPDYRMFVLAHTQALFSLLDAIPVSKEDVANAKNVILQSFDMAPSVVSRNWESLACQLRQREVGVSHSTLLLREMTLGKSNSAAKRRRDSVTKSRGIAAVSHVAERSPAVRPTARTDFVSESPKGSAITSDVAITASPISRAAKRAALLRGFADSSPLACSLLPASFRQSLENRPIQDVCENQWQASSDHKSNESRQRHGPFVCSDFESRASFSLLSMSGEPEIEYLCEPEDRPRQFEFCPTNSSQLVFGTEQGNLVVLDQDTRTVVASCTTDGREEPLPKGHSYWHRRRELPRGCASYQSSLYFDERQAHTAPVLGLSWFNKQCNYFIAGNASGLIHVYNVERMQEGNRQRAIHACDTFDKLTSIHVNSNDERFAVSGYTTRVGIFDLETGKIMETMNNCHRQHINVLKFSNTNPHVLVTSSFDHYIKKWDLRERRPGGSARPIFQRSSRKGNVMVCFSPDDEYLLVSAVDNEVVQYTASDGRRERVFNIAKTGSDINYTRSYYMNGRDYIITGSCQEDVVRIYNARTGQFFREVDMDRRRGERDELLYVQSLRANPRHSFNFAALLSLDSNTPYMVIAGVDLHRRSLM